MRRAHDESSGWQQDQAGRAGQQPGATGTGPGAPAGAAATGGGQAGTSESTAGGTEERYRTTSTTRTYEEGAQPTSGFARTEPGGGYGPTSTEAIESTTQGGLFLLLAGLLTFLVGLAFVVRHGFYHASTAYAYNWNIVSWGWVLFGLGVVAFAVGASHLLGIPFSRPVGIVVAVLTAVAGFMIIPFYPLWGIIVVALGLAALWGLAAEARTRARQREMAEHERQRQMM